MSTESVILLAAAIAVGALFAAPLAFAPLRWARLFGWSIPDDRALASYFGRCLGAVIAALVALSFWGAFDEAARKPALAVNAVAAAWMVPIHVVGMIRRQQPASEDAETVLWVAAAAVFAWGWLHG